MLGLSYGNACGVWSMPRSSLVQEHAERALPCLGDSAGWASTSSPALAPPTLGFTSRVRPPNPDPNPAGRSHTSDGTIVVGGGDWANSGFLVEGRYALRTWAKDGTAWAVR